jgi:hypothetical protein
MSSFERSLIVSTNLVGYEEVLHGVKEERNILHAMKRKDRWIGYLLRRNCQLKHVINRKGGRVEVRRRGGRRGKQLLDDLKETRWYWELKEEAIDRTMRRTRFGRGCGPDMRQIRY